MRKLSGGIAAWEAAAAVLGAAAGLRLALKFCRKRRLARRLRREVLGALKDISMLPEWDPSSACVILSGGLDTSVVSEVGKDILDISAAFTVLTGEEATDRPYAIDIARKLSLTHYVLDLSLEELLAELPWTIRVLESFDPMGLRNGIAIATALKAAHRLGFKCAVTGDGADEILGGYNFTHRLPPQAWMEHRAHMARVMSFDSVPLGRDLGIFVASPYTQERVVSEALTFRKADCVEKFEGKLIGKVPLRRAFPAVRSAWRVKDPIEVGCGSTQLGSRPWLGRKGYFDNRLDEAEFSRAVQSAKDNYDVVLRDPEHLAYFEAFLEVFPGGKVDGKERNGSDPCPMCKYQMSNRFQTFCVTCGHYDANLRKPGNATA